MFRVLSAHGLPTADPLGGADPYVVGHVRGNPGACACRTETTRGLSVKWEQGDFAFLVHSRRVRPQQSPQA